MKESGIHACRFQGHEVFSWLFFAVVLFFSALAEAASAYQPQHGDLLLEHWRWTHFTEMDGKGFQCMVETKDGSMWFGVQHGVIRYDGKQWTTYNSTNGFSDAQVVALCAAQDGTLWAGSASDISYFKDGTWTSVLSMGTASPDIGVNQITESADGTIWACLGVAVLGLKNNAATLYARPEDAKAMRALLPSVRFCPLPEKVTQGAYAKNILEDRAGRIWLASSRGTLAGWDPKVGTANEPDAWRISGENQDLNVQLNPKMCLTRDGQILMGNGQGKNALSVYDPETDRWSVTLAAIPPPLSVFEARDGTVWASAHSRIMTRRGDAWRIYEAAELDISPNRMWLFEASDGALWLGLQDGKVYRIDYSERRWSSYEGLNFLSDSVDGAEWFLSVEGAVIRHLGAEWTKYDVSDGLMSDPVTLLCAKDSRTWAAGSHEGVAATAFFEKGKWQRQLHTDLGWTIDFRSMLEGSDGRLWFGGNIERISGKPFLGGLACCQKSPDGTNQWVYLHPPKVPERGLLMAQAPDGKIFFGGAALWEQTKTGWSKVTKPSDLGFAWMDAVAASPAGDLWVARGGIAVFGRQAGTWTKYDVASGLANLMVSTLLCSSDGTVWAATKEGISRFDGRSWTPNAFATGSIVIDRESGTLRQSPDGRIWINKASRPWYFRAKTGLSFTRATLPGFRTIGYLEDHAPPETRLKVTFKEVSQPGNTLIAWEGTDAWGLTPANQLEFSYRFDGGTWSAYRAETQKMFLALPSGEHTFDVRARDMDYNVDPTPAQFRFLVIQPVWRQPWFLGLVGAFLVILGFMEYRVLRRNYRLRIEVNERKQAQTKVEQQKEKLENQKDRLELEIDQRKQAEVEVEKVHKQLLTVSRRAGMAEVATDVLHNVGNVLNSVNVSASLVAETIQRSKATSIAKVAALLDEHTADLGAFLTRDEKGQKLPVYLGLMAEEITQEQHYLRKELTALCDNVEHIKQIVAMQQDYARVSGVTELIPVHELAEDALKMHVGAYLRHGVQLEREYGEVPPIMTDRHKVLQILLNLLHNAKYACEEGKNVEKRITIRISKNSEDRVRIEVVDTGIGIPQENLTRIFNHGFTTRPNGHGFGLHSGANAAKELGGSLIAHSEGWGKGATFVLELPISRSSAPSP